MRRLKLQAISSLLLIATFLSVPFEGNAQYTDVNFGGTGVSISYYPSGSDGSDQGDVILYENVTTVSGQSIDCYVTVDSVTGNAITNVDQNSASGSYYNNNAARFFSPFANMPSGGGITTFSFQFIEDGTFSYNTSTGTVSATNTTIDSVRVNSYDLDGNGSTNSNQYTEFGGFASSEIDANSNLIYGTASAAHLTRWISNTSAGTTDATASENRVRVFYDTMSMFQISVGSGASGLAYFFLEFAAGYDFSSSDTYYQVQGNVLNDGNGLYGNSMVDGSGMGMINTSPLYVNLINSGDSVIESKQVDIIGSYSFAVVPNGSYTILLTDNNLTVNSAGNTTSLPSLWGCTGENIGTAAGSDGTIDGEISITLNGSNIQNANFGINKTPIAVSCYGQLPSPSNGDTLVVGAASLLLGGMATKPSGIDYEDGIITSPDVIEILTLPKGTNKLLYDKVEITYGDNGTTVPSISNPYTIYSFDNSKLEFVVFDRDSVEFEYSIMDNAGTMASSPATYAYFWSNPLPVEFISVEANWSSDSEVEVKWSTASELNNSHFEVQRSMDGGYEFETIGTVKGANHSNSILNYTLADYPVKEAALKIYYRIKQIDYDGKYDYSDVVSLEVAKELKTKIYPNPVQGSEHLSIEINLEIEAIHIIDQNGKDITGELEIAPLNGIYNIDVNTLKSGIYFIEVVSSKQKASYKFLKL